MYPEDAMSRLESIETELKQLNADELKRFREWFFRLDADAWDLQFEADVRDGKLNKLAEKAIRDHQSGRSTDL